MSNHPEGHRKGPGDYEVKGQFITKGKKVPSEPAEKVPFSLESEARTEQQGTQEPSSSWEGLGSYPTCKLTS